jgi:hypothetical protein
MIRLFLAACLLTHVCLADEVALQYGPHKDLKIKPQPAGVLDITLSEGHPHFWTGLVPKTYDPAKHSVFSLEYFSPAGLDSVTLRYRQADGGMAVAETITVPLAETWQPLVFDLSQVEVKPAHQHPEMRFHLALNGKAGTQLQIRQMKVREASAEEKAISATREKTQSDRETEAAAISADLHASYAAHIETVHVGLNEIAIIGKAPAKMKPLRLIGLPPETPSFKANAKTVAAEVQPDEGGSFRVNLPRLAAGSLRDRAVWRWRLADEDGRWVSAASWPTAYGPAVGRKLAKQTAPHQKGIGVPPITNPDHELFTLGLRHATLNVPLHALFRESAAPGWSAFDFEGARYFVNDRQIQQMDQTLRLMLKNDIIVSAILLIGNGRHGDGSPHNRMTHPEALAQGIYSIPNLTAEAPVQFYQAALHHLAERWSRADGENGRVTNWIMHNEVDQAATWTNMGAQPLARYLETYMRSARLMHHRARLFDPHARVFMSLTHHWAKKSSGSGTYIVREMIETFAEMSRAEGDFEWGLAYHPYPRDLRNPDAWKDEGLTDDFDTPHITPKNIAVLPRFMDQARFHFQGKPRGILLSEQGFNTPTLSLEDQRRQVAGLIYMFRQIRPLKAIEAFHLHRYHDMPVQEGGLRLGIITETGAHKLGWDVYKAIGTDQEAEFGKIADEVIGLAKP